jgi:hypothetical protein
VKPSEGKKLRGPLGRLMFMIAQYALVHHAAQETRVHWRIREVLPPAVV